MIPPVLVDTDTLPAVEPAARGEETAQVAHLVDAAPAPRLHAQVQRLIVNAYRVAGFTILTAILIGLASYLTSQLFFMVSRSWITPTVVSPTDEKVIQLGAQYAERAAQLDKLVADRESLLAQLADSKRIVSMNMEFQGAFKHAIKSDLDGKRNELASVRSLMNRYKRARQDIERANQAYASMSEQRLADDKKAGLIANDQYLSGNYQIAQISNANLSLAEREAQLNQQATALSRDTEAHEALLPSGGGGSMGWEMLKIREELSKAQLEEQRARENGKALEKGIAALDRVIERYGKIVKGIGESPLLLATEQNLTVAFVPYDNLHNVAGDAPIYACRLGMLWCRQVGKIGQLLGAEVQNKHPLRNDMLRGQMAQMLLTDASAAHERVLYVNRAPVLF